MNTSSWLCNEQYFVRRSQKKLSQRIVSSTIDEIIIFAESRLNQRAKNLKVLDVGCGTGDYAFELEKYVKKVIGVEPFQRAFKKALKRRQSLNSNVIFSNLPIEDFHSSYNFDVAISLTTLEHMPNAEVSYDQVFKLLRPGGILYLTAPNKLWPIEPHYGLPFLGWLPVPLANAYLRFTNKGSSYENSSYARTYKGLKDLLNRFDCQYEFVLPLNPNTAYLGCGESDIVYRLVKNIGIKLISKHPFFWNFSKGFIVVATKNRK